MSFGTLYSDVNQLMKENDCKSDEILDEIKELERKFMNVQDKLDDMIYEAGRLLDDIEESLRKARE